VSNIDRPGRTGRGSALSPSTGTPTAPRARVTMPTEPGRDRSGDFPSPAGTAVLNLTTDQVVRIRVLLLAMRLGKAVAEDVRKQIFGLLTGGQRRVAGAAWFILSVRA
jgi:hypothetical protein